MLFEIVRPKMRIVGLGVLCILSAQAQQITLQPCNLAVTEVFRVNSDSTISAPGGQCVGISGGSVAAMQCTSDATQKWTWLSNGCVSNVAGLYFFFEIPAHPAPFFLPSNHDYQMLLVAGMHGKEVAP